MGYVEYVLWKAGAAWREFAYFWPVAVLLTVPGLLGAVRKPSIWSCARPVALLQLTPLVLSTLILVAGVLGENLKPWPPGQLVRAAELAIYGLLLLHGVAGVALTVLAKGCRLLAGSVQAVLLWWAICTAIAVWKPGPFL